MINTTENDKSLKRDFVLFCIIIPLISGLLFNLFFRYLFYFRIGYIMLYIMGAILLPFLIFYSFFYGKRFAEKKQYIHLYIILFPISFQLSGIVIMLIELSSYNYSLFPLISGFISSLFFITFVSLIFLIIGYSIANKKKINYSNIGSTNQIPRLICPFCGVEIKSQISQINYCTNCGKSLQNSI